MQKKIVFLSLFLTLIFFGCNTTPSSSSLANEYLSQDKEKIVSIKQYAGTMDWQDNDSSSNSLCAGIIHSQINFDLTVDAENKTVSGTGKIIYQNTKYNTKRRCADCVITGQDATFLITGNLLPQNSDGNTNQQETVRLKFNLDPNSALTEKQTSKQCFGDKPQNYNESRLLYFSLFQAGFFDYLNLELPSTVKEKTTHNLQWHTNNHSGGGVLTLQLS
ncbi:MAG: hypothetical protein A2233_04480 [Candidatus Kerfeldbacteria bacterium RIFOXYA2_FULL_38_24]|uniref:Lipoprotein n=1 Tax=Candidatus Kerfeldbacteria bacterium RIFOXYB2_FULL_38_14 TaxID=1798547 RepID=A0A1G2BBE7_9BACT|nr:MAG: hypothetical protein A2233_04480 [Candidatus Kerfeldbacteria bacterium RIFOXYA2_FULL_38_24]OGY86355.1 MAG: hypothetical protein A2319_03080 [Candidatus Kerfeldbacteria bacterium RIFOXYB2_FULL_38_14]OGY89848.1 MAG: hypothetical protein A2458_04970 [Candidatus Kerfeldbacteria bacterium RIFOXYC2_FULL_38_9]